MKKYSYVISRSSMVMMVISLFILLCLNLAFIMFTERYRSLANSEKSTSDSLSEYFSLVQCENDSLRSELSTTNIDLGRYEIIWSRVEEDKGDKFFDQYTKNLE
jgi:hypothetical protein